MMVNNGMDYSGGLIFGYKYNKSLGVFIEGKYNKYWNREWHDFFCRNELYNILKNGERIK